MWVDQIISNFNLLIVRLSSWNNCIDFQLEINWCFQLHCVWFIYKRWLNQQSVNLICVHYNLINENIIISAN